MWVWTESLVPPNKDVHFTCITVNCTWAWDRMRDWKLVSIECWTRHWNFSISALVENSSMNQDIQRIYWNCFSILVGWVWQSFRHDHSRNKCQVGPRNLVLLVICECFDLNCYATQWPKFKFTKKNRLMIPCLLQVFKTGKWSLICILWAVYVVITKLEFSREWKVRQEFTLDCVSALISEEALRQVLWITKPRYPFALSQKNNESNCERAPQFNWVQWWVICRFIYTRWFLIWAF